MVLYKWYSPCQSGDYISPIPPIKVTRKQLLIIEWDHRILPDPPGSSISRVHLQLKEEHGHIFEEKRHSLKILTEALCSRCFCKKNAWDLCRFTGSFMWGNSDKNVESCVPKFPSKTLPFQGNRSCFRSL